MPNISELIQFKWFDWLWYFDIKSPVKESLGRYLGPAEHAGESFTPYILTNTGAVIIHSSTRPLSTVDLNTTHIQNDMKLFMENMNLIIGNNAPSTMRNHSEYTEDP